MTIHQGRALRQGIGVSLTPTLNGLAAIMDPACSAAIWMREPLPRFQSWIDGLSKVQLPRARIMLRAEMVRDAMVDLAEAHALPDCAERSTLIDDVTALADRFSSLMESRYLRLRLDVIETNACRKFHIDAVTARLICTYRGHATQYGNAEIGDDPDRVFEVPTGSPMVLRGTRWPSAADRGLLHRSPPIEGTGETRLVLVLDPISDPNSDAISDPNSDPNSDIESGDTKGHPH